MNTSKVDMPVNTSERYLYGINIRLDAIIEILSSLVITYAKQNNVATTNNEIVEEVPVVEIKETPRKKSKK